MEHTRGDQLGHKKRIWPCENAMKPRRLANARESPLVTGVLHVITPKAKGKCWPLRQGAIDIREPGGGA
eukprot:1368839-Pleurochrysis_carterae.AAC.6